MRRRTSGGRSEGHPGSASPWSYYVAVDEVYHSKWASKQLARLEVVREAVRHLWPRGYPVKLIQVAGTSGKGSTCQFLQRGLSAYTKAGCYVKPHVFDYSERFVVEDGLASHEEIADVWARDIRPYCVQSALRGEVWVLDHFEASLLVALRIFERHKLRWAVIETGLGGRYDPVTALKVEATVLTNVGQDHEEVLGQELWQRALEKGGICRPGVPLFTADSNQITKRVLSGLCRDVGSPLHILSAGDVRTIRDAWLKADKSALSGALLESRYQATNAALAAKVILQLIPSAKIKTVVSKFLDARFVGRFWAVEKDVFADVAHNPSKTKALSEDLGARFGDAKLVLVVGITGARDPVAVIGPLVAHARAVVVTSAGFKGQDPERVFSSLKESYPGLPMQLASDPGTALSVARNLTSKGEKILFTGSTYMIDQALNKDDKLKLLNGSVGWREHRQRQVVGTLSFSLPESQR
ncbi:MAG: hypothetical protein HY247_04455 [archaeon]|nr:MAG: hypothetical protein HY247_04455 [archaeon]